MKKSTKKKKKITYDMLDKFMMENDYYIDVINSSFCSIVYTPYLENKRDILVIREEYSTKKLFKLELKMIAIMRGMSLKQLKNEIRKANK